MGEGSRNAFEGCFELTKELREPVTLAVLAAVVARLFLASDVDAVTLAVLAAVVARLFFASDVDAVSLAVLAAVVARLFLASDVDAVSFAVLAAVVAWLFFASNQHRQARATVQGEITLRETSHGFSVGTRGHGSGECKLGGDLEQFFCVHNNSPIHLCET